MEITVRGVILLVCKIKDLPTEAIFSRGYRLLYVLKDGAPELMICTEEDLSYERIKQDLQELGIYVLLETIYEQIVMLDYFNNIGDKLIH